MPYSTQYFIQEGQVFRQHTKRDQKGMFSLNKFVKKMLTFFHVPFIDDCCDPVDQRTLPIRYDNVAHKIQYYNIDTNAWTNLSSF